ncbi:competence protein ComGD [Anaerovirgula multivorans]|uniref:Competence protein ComGD n=1 Tax=Anaerovirgula multivorans TaxID=312168 RepID=A0A238ZUI1_9FIRM|nr:prepilin-type N-terminal cleavage/methylation domain-containing protein [Anaerovirgula multivorans]SNR86568.1 competence protein ComGD [Anaerovirgula multivorans]
MLSNNKGFTLIEILLVVTIITLFGFMIFPMNRGLYDRFLLEATAKEIKSALHIAQQLSIDESRNYCVEVFEKSFRVREHKIGGKVAYSQKIDDRIKVMPGYDHRINYNREGTTSYGIFVLSNKQEDKIKLEVLLGTGRVRISSLY